MVQIKQMEHKVLLTGGKDLYLCEDLHDNQYILSADKGIRKVVW